MIKVYGTSHVSEDSIKLIEEKIEEEKPDIVALELDMIRLKSLLSGRKSRGGPVYLRLIRKLQEHIGSKTGVMPGEEMEYAYRKSIQEDITVYLIDQDIRETFRKIRGIPRKEKVKALGSIVLSFFVSTGFDIYRIPEQETVDRLAEEMEKRFPNLYRILLEERNHLMADALLHIQEEHPEADIVAFVGAAHRKGIDELISRETA